MSTRRVLLPNQLFPGPDQGSIVIEHPKFFSQYRYHKQKLVLHRASIDAYTDEHDLEHISIDERWQQPFEEADKVLMYDPVDHRLREQFRTLASKHDTELVFEETPQFLATQAFNTQYFEEHEYRQISYYQQMRQRFDVLVTDDGKPVGGKWSFDPENREKLPDDVEPPEKPSYESEYIEEAKEWVQNRFPDNPGSIKKFDWPVTREQAFDQLDDFLDNRLEQFGPYQDAFDPSIDTGFHSLLSPALNLGLITPQEVIDRTLEAHEEHEYPLQSLEGFLRQIMGWREFVRALYELEPEMREASFWDHDRSLDESFYTSETGIEPVDQAIHRVMDRAYTHHIERLMVLGNIMLLCEIDPDGVYDWFMELFIDAYEWVMLPNIYGMSQYAWPDMMTKPYISSSNYITKMSHYSGDWETEWDSLYWRFIQMNKDTIEDIPRMAVMTSHLDRMNDETLQEHKERADQVIERLTDQS